MQKLSLVLALLLLAAVSFASADGKKDSTKTELKWRTFDAGSAEARKTGKKILLDIYTDWCVWCKRLDQNVYADPAVAGYLEKYYIPVKLNAESDAKVHYKDTSFSSSQFAQGVLQVTGYPTIYFLDANGEPINRLGGYVDAGKFLPIIRFIGEDYYKKMKWEEFLNTPAGAAGSPKK